MKLMKLDRASNLMGETLDGKQLEEVTSFEYLEVRIQNNGDNFKEVKKRLAMGATAPGRLKSLWRDMDITIQMKILKVIVFPVASYGCESWVFKGGVEKWITAFENKCLQKILRIFMSNTPLTRKYAKVCLVEKAWPPRSTDLTPCDFFCGGL